MKNYSTKLFSLAFAGLFIFSSCGESTSTEEKSEINIMDSTSKSVKENTEQLEKQTKKVEESLEKLDKEFQAPN